MADHGIETRLLIEALIGALERGARFIRRHDKNPDELRGWIKRVESGFAPKGGCLPAADLERAATEGKAFLAREAAA